MRCSAAGSRRQPTAVEGRCIRHRRLQAHRRIFRSSLMRKICLKQVPDFSVSTDDRGFYRFPRVWTFSYLPSVALPRRGLGTHPVLPPSPSAVPHNTVSRPRLPFALSLDHQRAHPVRRVASRQRGLLGPRTKLRVPTWAISRPRAAGTPNARWTTHQQPWHRRQLGRHPSLSPAGMILVPR